MRRVVKVAKLDLLQECKQMQQSELNRNYKSSQAHEINLNRNFLTSTLIEPLDIPMDPASSLLPSVFTASFNKKRGIIRQHPPHKNDERHPFKLVEERPTGRALSMVIDGD
jgi:hypothetical protein